MEFHNGKRPRMILAVVILNCDAPLSQPDEWSLPTYEYYRLNVQIRITNGTNSKHSKTSQYLEMIAEPRRQKIQNHHIKMKQKRSKRIEIQESVSRHNVKNPIEIWQNTQNGNDPFSK